MYSTPCQSQFIFLSKNQNWIPPTLIRGLNTSQGKVYRRNTEAVINYRESLIYGSIRSYGALMSQSLKLLRIRHRNFISKLLQALGETIFQLKFISQGRILIRAPHHPSPSCPVPGWESRPEAPHAVVEVPGQERAEVGLRGHQKWPQYPNQLGQEKVLRSH